jgi:hypothetical protein
MRGSRGRGGGLHGCGRLGTLFGGSVVRGFGAEELWRGWERYRILGGRGSLLVSRLGVLADVHITCRRRSRVNPTSKLKVGDGSTMSKRRAIYVEVRGLKKRLTIFLHVNDD